MFRNVRAIPSLSMDPTHRVNVAVLSRRKPKLQRKKGNARYKVENSKKNLMYITLQ